MSIQDPKTKGGQQQKPQQNKSDQQKKAFDKGNQNNSTNQPITGHEEKHPRQPATPGQKDQPKVTNQDKDITNSDRQNRIDEEPVDENSKVTDLSDNKDPEIDTPIYDPEKTEKKIPTMKGDTK